MGKVGTSLNSRRIVNFRSNVVSVKVKVSKGALRASRKALIPEGVPELLSSGHEGARTGRRGHSFRLRGHRSRCVGS